MRNERSAEETKRGKERKCSSWPVQGGGLGLLDHEFGRARSGYTPPNGSDFFRSVFRVQFTGELRPSITGNKNAGNAPRRHCCGTTELRIPWRDKFPRGCCSQPALARNVPDRPAYFRPRRRSGFCLDAISCNSASVNGSSRSFTAVRTAVTIAGETGSA